MSSASLAQVCFAAEIAPTIDALAIWASSPMDVAGLVPLITALRDAIDP